MVRVTVLDNTQSRRCEGCRGLDLSSLATLKSTVEILRRRFGKDVDLKYIDLASTTSRAYAKTVKSIQRGELTVPVLLINGKPRISGYFDLHLLVEAIQAEIEMGSEK